MDLETIGRWQDHRAKSPGQTEEASPKNLGHQISHIIKALGPIAATAEHRDHGEPDVPAEDKRYADLIIHAVWAVRCAGKDPARLVRDRILTFNDGFSLKEDHLEHLVEAAMHFEEPQPPDGGDFGESDLHIAARQFRKDRLGISSLAQSPAEIPWKNLSVPKIDAIDLTKDVQEALERIHAQAAEQQRVILDVKLVGEPPTLIMRAHTALLPVKLLPSPHQECWNGCQVVRDATGTDHELRHLHAKECARRLTL